MAEPNPSVSPGHPIGPAVEFAEWLPALGGSRLLRVHGEVAGGSAPALVLDTPAGDHRVEPRSQARFTRAHEWRASYLIASEVAAGGWSAATLEWPNGTRVHLPEPAEPGAQVVDPAVLSTLRARRVPAVDRRASADRAPRADDSPPPPFAARSPAAAPSPPAAAGSAVAGAHSWTEPPGGFASTVFAAEAVWTARRAELERELNRSANAIARAHAGERASRDAVLAALAAMRADLRAARAARAADADTIATLKAELEAERIAHAVARRTAADLRAALAQTRRRGPDDLGAALKAERKARADAEEALRQTREAGSALMQRVAELSRARELDREALERHAREQAESAAAAARRPEQETGELVANLEAAAASLRASSPPPEAEPTPSGPATAPPAHDAGPVDAVPSEPTTSDFAALTEALGGPPARPLRRVLVALAERDPVAAGEVLVGLLPAQGPVFSEPVAYDLTVAGIGTFAVSVRDGAATIERVSKPRSRSQALFELRSDALTLAELLAGDARRIGRFRGPARVSRRRRRTRLLEALPAATMSLREALACGARLEPALVYKLLPLAIDPEWTAGHAFTIAQEITEPDARTWYLIVRDGAGLEVTESSPDAPQDARVTMTRAAFERLLRDEPSDPGERPLVRGDRAAVAILKAWTDRARGAC